MQQTMTAQRIVPPRLSVEFIIDTWPYLPTNWIDALVAKYVARAMEPRAVDQNVAVQAMRLAAALVKQQRPQVQPVPDNQLYYPAASLRPCKPSVTVTVAAIVDTGCGLGRWSVPAPLDEWLAALAGSTPTGNEGDLRLPTRLKRFVSHGR